MYIPSNTLKCLTWNCEGFRRTSHDLSVIVDEEEVDLIFLSEPWLFQADLPIATSLFAANFSFDLNSDDKANPELPLTSNRAHGGTFVLWRHYLSKFITVITIDSSRILPVLIRIPGHRASAHICLYLPQVSLESEYLEELSKLETVVSDLEEKYPDIIIHCRGDANASIPKRSNNKRDNLFEFFYQRLSFKPVQIDHKTYHHFTGNGASDSSIDVILVKDSLEDKTHESVLKVICSRDSPNVDSKHDMILSEFSLQEEPTNDALDPPLAAPTVENKKHKIVWSEIGIHNYETLLSPTLEELQHNFQDTQSPALFSVILQCTNEALSSAAKATNKCIDLTKDVKRKPPPLPKPLTDAAKIKKNSHKNMKTMLNDPTVSEEQKLASKTAFTNARREYRKLLRQHEASGNALRDEKLHSLLNKDPKKAFNEIRKHKNTGNYKISELKVDDEVFPADFVGEGFFKHISKLKTKDPNISSCDSCPSLFEDYRMIKEICKSGLKIPKITFNETEKLLLSLRPSVTDHWNISAAHFLNAGHAGVTFFQFLLNTAINEIDYTECDEVNTAHAIILHKGHNKDKNASSSYRTISTCPLLAKALDSYVRSLSIDDWHNARSEVQFLGPGMSHELSALLLTETITHSINNNDQPVFALFLDARSAFDKTIKEIMIRQLYLLGTKDHKLMYLDNRLGKRKTFIEWEKKIMGPIQDQTGVKQGGIPSSDLYAVYNNEQLDNAQDVGLGIDVHDEHVASIGLADDVVCLSHDVHLLKHILELSFDYCKKYHVTLAPEKTKLVSFYSPRHKTIVDHHESVSSLSINGSVISFACVASRTCWGHSK